jgi:hypothetical protein
MDAVDFTDWQEVYRKLVYWEMQIDATEDKSMAEVLSAQKTEADHLFSNYVTDRYEEWISSPNADRPLQPYAMLKEEVFPILDDNPLFFIVIDNLRYDQWKMIEPEIARYFKIDEKIAFSILPTATAYARNALFAGMLPNEIKRRFPDLWVGEEEDEGKNNYEAELLEANLARNGLGIKWSYHKILKAEEGKHLNDNLDNLLNNPLNAVVFNFVDMLSHARTDMQMIRELAPDESAYRSLTKSWFHHSPLLELLKNLAHRNIKVVLTTDHGTIRVNKAQKIVGDRNTNTNLRYKLGKNLAFDEDEVFFHRDPEKIGLPKSTMSSTYVFAKNDTFFAYPNNYNHYVRHYKDTFQHGGVSMEEMLIPFITLSAK